LKVIQSFKTFYSSRNYLHFYTPDEKTNENSFVSELHANHYVEAVINWRN